MTILVGAGVGKDIDFDGLITALHRLLKANGAIFEPQFEFEHTILDRLEAGGAVLSYRPAKHVKLVGCQRRQHFPRRDQYALNLANPRQALRSEERRVGKEWRARG